MLTYEQKPKTFQQTKTHKSVKPGRLHYRQHSDVHSILRLNRLSGNSSIAAGWSALEAGLARTSSKEPRTPGLETSGEIQESHAAIGFNRGYGQTSAYARTHGGVQSQWVTQNGDQQTSTTPPTLAPDQLIHPPVFLNGEPTVRVRPRLIAANTDHSVHLTVAEMEARALWNVDSGRQDLGDWAVGFYQALIPLDMHHCYEPLSRPPGPGSFPVSGQHWVTRRQPIQTHEFDFLHSTSISTAGPGQPIVATTRDMPGIRRADAFVRPGTNQPWTRICESAYLADFYLQAVAINTTSNLFLPLWNTRWMVAARVSHRHPGAPSRIESTELSPFRAEVVSSDAHSLPGGHRGLVRGLSRSSSHNTGRWEPGCPVVT
jgi:hypothetical protein